MIHDGDALGVRQGSEGLVQVESQEGLLGDGLGLAAQWAVRRQRGSHTVRLQLTVALGGKEQRSLESRGCWA